LETALQNNPFQTVEHLKQQLQQNGVKCRSSSTVSKWIRQNLNYSRKRITGKYVVRNDNIARQCREFKSKVSQFGLQYDQAISIDETSIYFSENSKYGYTPKGVPLRHRVQNTRVRIRRLTLLLAVSSQKVIHYRLLEGSCNSSVFSKFVDEIPCDAPRAILMDNVAFHKTKAVKEVMKKANFSEWFVPPYSPDYNPIEYVFATLKKRLRAYVDVHGILTIDVVDKHVHSFLSANVLENCFRHCWRLLEGGCAASASPSQSDS
jgi:transposase